MFIIYTDAGKVQLRAIISQKNKPIALYSRKLNNTQVNHTTKERELLSIIETLKELKYILFGLQIQMFSYRERVAT